MNKKNCLFCETCPPCPECGVPEGLHLRHPCTWRGRPYMRGEALGPSGHPFGASVDFASLADWIAFPERKRQQVREQGGVPKEPGR